MVAEGHGAITEGVQVWIGSDLGPGLDSASPCRVILPWLTFLWMEEVHVRLSNGGEKREGHALQFKCQAEQRHSTLSPQRDEAQLCPVR